MWKFMKKRKRDRGEDKKETEEVTPPTLCMFSGWQSLHQFSCPHTFFIDGISSTRDDSPIVLGIA